MALDPHFEDSFGLFGGSSTTTGPKSAHPSSSSSNTGTGFSFSAHPPSPTLLDQEFMHEVDEATIQMPPPSSSSSRRSMFSAGSARAMSRSIPKTSRKSPDKDRSDASMRIDTSSTTTTSSYSACPMDQGKKQAGKASKLDVLRKGFESMSIRSLLSPRPKEDTGSAAREFFPHPSSASSSMEVDNERHVKPLPRNHLGRFPRSNPVSAAAAVSGTDTSMNGTSNAVPSLLDRAIQKNVVEVSHSDPSSIIHALKQHDSFNSSLNSSSSSGSTMAKQQQLPPVPVQSIQHYGTMAPPGTYGPMSGPGFVPRTASGRRLSNLRHSTTPGGGVSTAPGHASLSRCGSVMTGVPPALRQDMRRLISQLKKTLSPPASGARGQGHNSPQQLTSPTQTATTIAANNNGSSSNNNNASPPVSVGFIRKTGLRRIQSEPVQKSSSASALSSSHVITLPNQQQTEVDQRTMRQIHMLLIQVLMKRIESNWNDLHKMETGAGASGVGVGVGTD